MDRNRGAWRKTKSLESRSKLENQEKNAENQLLKIENLQ
jgi:hypothetical protein